MSKLIVYEPVYGSFFFKTDELTNAKNAVKARLGETVFKQGYSAQDPAGVTQALKVAYAEAGIKPITPQGLITGVELKQTSDGTNHYQQLWISLSAGEDLMAISVDLGSDVAKRLLAKLNSVDTSSPVKLSAWATIENRNGRSFINHCVSIKSADGMEIPAVSGLFAQAKANADKVLELVGSSDKAVVDSVRKAEQTKVFLKQLEIVQAKFAQVVDTSPNKEPGVVVAAVEPSF